MVSVHKASWKIIIIIIIIISIIIIVIIKIYILLHFVLGDGLKARSVLEIKVPQLCIGGATILRTPCSSYITLHIT
jgi:hypothetical protein